MDILTLGQIKKLESDVEGSVGALNSLINTRLDIVDTKIDDVQANADYAVSVATGDTATALATLASDIASLDTTLTTAVNTSISDTSTALAATESTLNTNMATLSTTLTSAQTTLSSDVDTCLTAMAANIDGAGSAWTMLFQRGGCASGTQNCWGHCDQIKRKYFQYKYIGTSQCRNSGKNWGISPIDARGCCCSCFYGSYWSRHANDGRQCYCCEGQNQRYGWNNCTSYTGCIGIGWEMNWFFQKCSGGQDSWVQRDGAHCGVGRMGVEHALNTAGCSNESGNGGIGNWQAMFGCMCGGMHGLCLHQESPNDYCQMHTWWGINPANHDTGWGQ